MPHSIPDRSPDHAALGDPHGGCSHGDASNAPEPSDAHNVPAPGDLSHSSRPRTVTLLAVNDSDVAFRIARETHGGHAGGTLVTIHNDGTLSYGAGYEPDGAARQFWRAIARNMPR